MKDKSITTSEKKIKKRRKTEETKLTGHEINTSPDSNNGFTNHTHILL